VKFVIAYDISNDKRREVDLRNPDVQLSWLADPSKEDPVHSFE
jgi:hypothetical protein